MNYTDIDTGLTKKQVEIRKKQKLVNYNSEVPTKGIKEIIRDNIFTLFNLLNLVLGLLIFLVGSYKNLLFLGVVICNTLISIFQEIRAKIEIDKLSIIAETKVNVKRDEKERVIGINEIVIDDIINFKVGNQVVVDSVVRSGRVEVDESFITGESKPRVKKTGDTILSGSFIVSGKCLAQVIHIGEDNYTSKITNDAKYIKKIDSLLLNSLNKIIKLVSIVIVPLGILLFINQFFIIHQSFSNAIVNVVAALIAMIPEGLVLLTSTALAVSSIKLAHNKVLIKQLYSIESLARVDTICFDKTGTLTEGVMEVSKYVPLTNKKYDIKEIMSEICNVFDNENETMAALTRYFGVHNNYKVEKSIPFSSDRKYSKVSFETLGTYILGAPEIILKEKYNDYDIDKYVKEGRIVLLAEEKYKDIYPIAIILIQDKIRKNVLKTIEYFKKENVDVKIVSGDNPKTILNIANRLNLGIKKYKDVSKLSDEKLEEIVEDYSIFGRVSPYQKKTIINALKKKGHKVAMIGDGVNDVLALKEADSSIALNNGSEAARNVGELVLLDSNFDAMPLIVKEGRRTINNIERSASLFIVKTVYATLLALIFVFLPLKYPFIPIQLTLTSSFTIGIPSFILALEPNKDLIKGNFLYNIFKAAIPTALTIVINILITVIFGSIFNIDSKEVSTIAVTLVGFTGFVHLYRICKPLNKLRTTLIVTLIIFFTFGVVGLNNLFSLTIFNLRMLLVMIVLFLNTILLLKVNTIFFEKKIYKRLNKILQK